MAYDFTDRMAAGKARAMVQRSELKRKQDPGFVDLDRMYEDQCADIVGR